MAEQDNVTPMMRHYQEVKKQHPSDLVFYRLGDFYELFYEDAKIASEVLDLTLTRRGNVNGEPIPMAGIPYHAVDNYATRLLKRGYSIVMCDQVGERKLGKNMERKVTRVITPGTVIEDNMLPERQDNIIASIYQDKVHYGFATLNLSSGKFTATQVSTPEYLKFYIDKIAPAEIIYPERFADLDLIKDCLCIKSRPQWTFDFQTSYEALCQQFKTQSLIGFDLEELTSAVCAAGSLLDYVRTTQNVTLEHITSISRYESKDIVLLDKCAQKNLELVTNLNGETYGTLLSVLDNTHTSMGSRQLRNMMLNPLRDNDKVNQRLDLVEAFMDFNKLDELADIFSSIGDIERIVGRIGLHSAKPRDLSKLRDSLALLPSIQYLLNTGAGPAAVQEVTAAPNRAHVSNVVAANPEAASDPTAAPAQTHSQAQEPTPSASLADETKVLPEFCGVLTKQKARKILAQWAANLPDLKAVQELLQRAIQEFPSLLLRDGGVIADGYNADLDMKRDLQNGAESTLADIEEREKARTGISTLKVRYNNVHGYYIEISKAAAQNAPMDYTRLQTLKNAERFITEELSELQKESSAARDEALRLEKQLFDEIQDYLIENLPALTELSQQLALMDACISLSRVALLRHYIRPQLVDQSYFKIVGGRHPVVEQLSTAPFISNGVELSDKQSLIVISGPNMGGKSTYMRQNALITIMARMGSFVPANTAIIGDVDRIFTRIGASDDLASGRSTFMVEMEETATILNNATAKSLVIMDEVGRGTSGLEGAAIAEAIVQYLAKELLAKTMFATHYTEVTTLVENYPNTQNLCFNAKEYHGKIVFLYHAQPGRQSRSFGIEVAQLAGIPDKITRQAIMFYHARVQELNQVNQFSPSLFASVEMLESASSDESADAKIDELEQQVATLQAQLRVAQQSSANQMSEKEQTVLDELKQCDCNSLTPIMALNLICNLQSKLK